jgi:acyl-lipid omega-6 desaturase (Delta-12 desaturase)
MRDDPSTDNPAAAMPTTSEWRAVVEACEKPSLPRAWMQIVTTFVPYVGLWIAMYWSLSVSLWLTAALAALAGAILVRVFIIFHDCGHGSFFASSRANAILGFITGMLTLTPYYHWRWQHALHHGTTGNLDRRGMGDIWTMTVREYLASTRWQRFAYRLSRNPLVLFVIAPLFIFAIRQRFPAKDATPRERRSVWWMNGALLAMAAVLSAIYGLVPYVMIQSIVMGAGGTAGVWLFYVQHQFEDAYWERHDDWDFTTAALRGSSFYELPAILRWLSGNIGYHHVHHLSSKIPNYNLRRCHESSPIFHAVKPMTLLGSLRSMKTSLWDEKMRRLVSFRHAKRQGRETGGGGDHTAGASK